MTMSVNINVELFKRYAPKKKLEIINSLSDSEIRMVSKETILRIVKEAGFALTDWVLDKKAGKRVEKASRNKRLVINNDRICGNNWNSNVYGLEYYKGELYVKVYFQMSSTDRQIDVKFSEFFRGDSYRGSCTEMNRYGEEMPKSFTYDRKEKNDILKSFLLEYVYTKYVDKLN